MACRRFLKPVTFVLLVGFTLCCVLSWIRKNQLALKMKPETAASADVRHVREGLWEMSPSMRKDWGNATITFIDLPDNDLQSDNRYLTSDGWPEFSKKYVQDHVPRSPFKRRFSVQWGFDRTPLLERPDVKNQPPKLITWMVKPRNVPPLPEPVRLRLCPEMPCRLTTNLTFQKESAALLWNGQIMRVRQPPARSHPDQVFVYHDNEPQKPDWNPHTGFKSYGWKNNVNWTWSYRNDADLKAYYGYVVPRPTPKVKNYTAIMANKTLTAVWMSSHCKTFGRREEYVKQLQNNGLQVDVYGGCGNKNCPRGEDDKCIETFSRNYKFLLAFENAFCTDYLSEKFYRYLDSDLIVVSRASNQQKDHAPPGTFINTNDFSSPKELAQYLKNLSQEQYRQILKNKDQYQPLFEDWPIRGAGGNVQYMQYHFEALGYCEMCRRLWNLDSYRKSIDHFDEWFVKGNCYPSSDLK